MAHNNSTPQSILDAPVLTPKAAPVLDAEGEPTGEFYPTYTTNRALRRAQWKWAKSWKARLKQESVPVYDLDPETKEPILDEDGEPVVLRYKKVTHQVPRKRSGMVHGTKVTARIATHVATKNADGTTTVEELGPVPASFQAEPFTATVDGEPADITQA